MQKIEYRVRPVTRFIVTRYEEVEDQEGRGHGGSSPHGEFDSPAMAYEVAYALCSAEHHRLGWPPFDERIRYPAIPDGVSKEPSGAGCRHGAYDHRPLTTVA